MTALQKLVERTYELAKGGYWDQVLSEWSEVPVIARRCSHYQKVSSGWTFLHQAAYFGHEAACRELIRSGASVSKLTRQGQTAVDISQEEGHSELAAHLGRALEKETSLWAPPTDPDLLPSSHLWSEATERCAKEMMLVDYGGGVVKIAHGERYFVDSFERILVGWHGTFDPPRGMDGESTLRT